MVVRSQLRDRSCLGVDHGIYGRKGRAFLTYHRDKEDIRSADLRMGPVSDRMEQLYVAAVKSRVQPCPGPFVHEGSTTVTWEHYSNINMIARYLSPAEHPASIVATCKQTFGYKS